MEGDFGQADHVHALAVVALGQGSRGGQPAGIAAHDLHDGDVLGAVDGGVPDDLLHDHADVLGSRAVAGGMVGDHQVVVDGLGHAHKADVTAGPCAVVGQLADGVHRVVARRCRRSSRCPAFPGCRTAFCRRLRPRASRAACSGSCPRKLEGVRLSSSMSRSSFSRVPRSTTRSSSRPATPLRIP